MSCGRLGSDTFADHWSFGHIFEHEGIDNAGTAACVFFYHHPVPYINRFM